MTPALLKRLFGVVAEQVEAFERRQDRRMDALVQRIDALEQRQDRRLSGIVETLGELARGPAHETEAREAGQRDLAERAESAARHGRDQVAAAAEAAARAVGDRLVDRLMGQQEQDPQNDHLAATISSGFEQVQAALARGAVVTDDAIVGLAGELTALLDEQLEVRQRRSIRASVDAVTRAISVDADTLVAATHDQVASVHRTIQERSDTVDARLEAMEAELVSVRWELARRPAFERDPEVGIHQPLASVEGALSELRGDVGRLVRRVGSVEETVRDQGRGHEEGSVEIRRAMTELAAWLERPHDHLARRLDHLEAALKTDEQGGHDHDRLTRQLDRLERGVAGVEAGIDEVRRRPAGDPQVPSAGVDELSLHLDALHGQLAELASGSGDQAAGVDDAREAMEALEQRLDRVTGLLEGQAAGSSQDRGVVHRLEALEDAAWATQRALGAILDRFDGDTPDAEKTALDGRLAALEAGLCNLRDAMGEASAHAAPGGPAWQREVTRALEQTEGELVDLRLTVSRQVHGDEDHRLRLRDDLTAVEGALADQQHALHKLVTSHDTSSYALRMELHRRLSDLNLNVAAQRRELSSSHTALEAGMSDQRYALHKLVTHLIEDQKVNGTTEWDRLASEPTPVGDLDDDAPSAAGHRPASSSGAPPAEPRPSRVSPGIERTLSQVLDCLLADHVEGVAREAHAEGNLESAALDELLSALDEMKLDRLGARFHTRGINRQKGKPD